ncbi:MAG TPA: hypothetical protein DDW23_02415 [Planctomycetes bacterium]|nr:hypothetical protein [Planctomycetota bacterium]
MKEIDRRGFLVRTGSGAAAFAFSPVLKDITVPANRAEILRLGVAGAGRQGRAILAELAKLPSAKVVAISEPDERRMKAGLRRAEGAKGYVSVQEMISGEDDMEAVVVATPTHLHREPAEAALQAGLHVYCEAPMCSTLEDAQALSNAASDAKGILAVGLQARTNPVYNLARSFVRAGALRETIALRGQWHKKTSWQFGTSEEHNWRLNPTVSLGLPGEEGSHQFDTFSWYLKKKPLRVRGTGAVRLHQDGRTIPDTVQLEMEYEGGLKLLWDSSLASSFEGRHELFRGSHASVKMAEGFGWMFKEADAPTQGWEVYASRQRFHNDEGITLIADATQLAKQGKLKEGIGLPHPPIYYALEAFIDSALTGKPAAAGASEGVAALAAGIAANQALVSDGWVEVAR